MKRLVITGDKKIVRLYSIVPVLSIVSMYLLGLDFKSTFAKYGWDINSTPIFIIGTLLSFVVFAIIMNKLVTIIHFNEETMGFGIFNLGKIEYSEIEKLSGDNKLEIHLTYKIKYIDILSLENNKAKYMEILTFLDNKVDGGIKPESIFGKLTQSYNTKFTIKEDEKLRIGGLLIFPAISFVSGIFNYFSLAVRQPIVQTSPIMTFIYGLTAIFSLVMTIVFFKKKFVAVKLMKIYFFHISFGIGVIDMVLKIVYSYPISALGVWGIIGGIIPILIVFRYLNISRRVKATFVN